MLKELIEILKKEIHSENILPVEGEFYNKIIQAIHKKLEESKKLRDISRLLAEKEITQIREVALTIFLVRIQKIFNRVINSLVIEEEKLAQEERLFLKNIRSFVEQFKAKLYLSEPSERKVKRRERRKYKLVVFCRKCPQFVDVNGVCYGPFEKGDVALLPVENAIALIRRNICKEL